MNYIILWKSQTNDGECGSHMIVSEHSLQGRLNEVANNFGGLGGAWGNTDIRCFELGKELKLEVEQTVHIKETE